MQIKSVKNDIVRQLCALHQAKGRKTQGSYLLEGRKLLLEALEEQVLPRMVLLEEGRHEEIQALLAARQIPYHTASSHVMEKICQAQTQQGVAAAMPIPDPQEPRYPMVVLDGVQDPGNCGTIWRTCEAAGFTAIAFLPGSADPYSPKVVRATMGSVLRIPAVVKDRPFLYQLREEGISLVVSSLSGKPLSMLPSVDGSYALVVGSEAKGVSKEAMALATHRVRIPMQGKVESLNAAIAAALLMYSLSKGGN